MRKPIRAAFNFNKIHCNRVNTIPPIQSCPHHSVYEYGKRRSIAHSENMPAGNWTECKEKQLKGKIETERRKSWTATRQFPLREDSIDNIYIRRASGGSVVDIAGWDALVLVPRKDQYLRLDKIQHHLVGIEGKCRRHQPRLGIFNV